MQVKREMAGNIMLFIAAFIWGTAFVAQSIAMDSIGPFTMSTIRSFVASATLLPISLLFRHQEEKRGVQRPSSPFGKWTMAVGGIACGLALCLASNLQQAGLIYTTVGKGGFITSLYIVLVPILGLFLKKKVHPILWICVGIASLGLYLLSLTDMSSVNRGDLLMLACAFFFAVHIHVIDYFAPRANGVALSCIQFAVNGVLSCILMLIFETPSLPGILAATGPILYVGMLSGGIAYTLQILGQERTNPVTGSLLMSLESVWSVLGGYVILHEVLSISEWIGCALMMTAILLAQIGPGFFRKKA